MFKFLFSIIFNGIKNRYNRSRFGECKVLLYHRVNRLNADPQLLCVSQENFDAHLSFLKKNARILTIAEFEDILRNRKKFPRGACLITFDDGYEDNLSQAVPVLDKYGAEALFFISTGNIEDQKEFWWDRLENIFINGKLQERRSIRYGDNAFDTSNPFAMMRAYEALFNLLKNKAVKGRDAYLDDLESQLEIPVKRSTHRSLNMNELKRFSASSSVIIGAHTVNHPKLSVLDPVSQQKEIKGSVSFLEHHLEYKICYFSFPFGSISDYTVDTTSIVKDLGFTMAFSNIQRACKSNDDIYQVPRLLVRDWNVDALKMNLGFK
jgi:peptidoglycan/xylan/chitin deacetylase (PgdA/CDA1 family)